MPINKIYVARRPLRQTTNAWYLSKVMTHLLWHTTHLPVTKKMCMKVNLRYILTKSKGQ